uniref:F-box domain-containing protein n=1 Tax=Tetradesmus obliquus TaxID=3088 RepID=A0A383VFH5_TETOB|eukprot:jgi/Sobl393_1/18226/SZX63492.1
MDISHGQQLRKAAMESRRIKHLPVDVLCLVLQHLNTKQRLPAGQASNAWLAAATAATTDISLAKAERADTAASLAAWLCRHSRHVHSFALVDLLHNYKRYTVPAGYTDVWLPFQQLKRLCSLVIAQERECMPVVLLHSPSDSFKLYSTSISSSSSSCEAAHVNPLAHVAATLTSLKLHRVLLDGFPGGWQCLGALTALQQLDLQQAPLRQLKRGTIPGFPNVGCALRHTWEPSELALDGRDIASPAELGGVLLQLTCLTQLRLAWEMDLTVRAALGLMTQLQELVLQRRPEAEFAPARDAAASPISFPASLTRLEVDLWQPLDHSHAACLAKLTSLRHLRLELRHLELAVSSGPAPAALWHQCDALVFPSRLTSLQLHDDASAEQLAQLSGLKRLTLLGLPSSINHWDDSDVDSEADADDDGDGNGGGAGGPSFTFLGLQHLMQLTQLTSLTVGAGCVLVPSPPWRDDDGEPREFKAPAPGRNAWDAPKLQRLLKLKPRWLALLLQQRDQELAALKASASSIQHSLAADITG